MQRTQIVGHTTANANAFTGLQREVTVDYTVNELRVHDGATAGGNRVLNLVQNDARYQAISALLTNVAALAAAGGIFAKTGAATLSARTLTAGTASVVITNGDGSAGNPTIDASANLKAYDGLVAVGGLVARTGATAVAARTLTGTANQLTVTNGDGSAGNPTFTLPAALIPPGTIAPADTATFSGSATTIAMVVKNAAEALTISATAATGTINFDVLTQAVLYYTTNAAANWTINFRGSAGTSLNTVMAIGQAVTCTFMVTQGGTAFFNNVYQVDGGAVTPKWQGGTAPSAGNINGVDFWTFTLVKTANAAFSAFGAQTQYK